MVFCTLLSIRYYRTWNKCFLRKKRKKEVLVSRPSYHYKQNNTEFSIKNSFYLLLFLFLIEINKRKYKNLFFSFTFNFLYPKIFCISCKYVQRNFWYFPLLTFSTEDEKVKVFTIIVFMSEYYIFFLHT